jgi:hypothetical protein
VIESFLYDRILLSKIKGIGSILLFYIKFSVILLTWRPDASDAGPYPTKQPTAYLPSRSLIHLFASFRVAFLAGVSSSSSHQQLIPHRAARPILCRVVPILCCPPRACSWPAPLLGPSLPRPRAPLRYGRGPRLTSLHAACRPATSCGHSATTVAAELAPPHPLGH